MKLTSEQTKRIMECIAQEMGVELGDVVTIRDDLDVVVDPKGFKSSDGWSAPVTIWRDIIRGDESFEKAPWEPALGQLYHYPEVCTTLGIDSDIWTDTTGDRLRRKRVGIYRTKEEAIQKARELGWVE